MGNFFSDVGDGIKSAVSTVTEGIGGTIGSAVLGGVGSFIGDSINPSEQAAPIDPEIIRLGHRLDDRSHINRAQFDWRKAKDRGLTPQEFYGSPAAGGSAASGGGATLGNSAAAANIQNSKIHQDDKQRTLDRNVELQKTKMQTDAQLKTAEISAGS